MANITKPAGMSTIWAASGIKTAPADLKIAQGWVVELPPYQTANFIENKQDQFNAHVNMHGIPQWDTATEYQGGVSFSKGSNGKIYKCILTNVNFDPTNALNSNYWTEAFEPFGSVAVVAADLATLNNKYLTLAGLSSAAAARANLSVYSKIESDIRFAAIGGLQTQTFAVGVATQPYHAIRLDQVSGLLVQATESTMGVARIASSIDMSTGTNDTDIVTPLKARNTFLTRSFNLSDLTSPATARVNLGLGSMATEAAASFLRASNNLSELTNATTARSNLGLGSAAIRGEEYFLRAANNLSDVPNDSTARTNLGLGNSATRNVGSTVGTVAAGDDTRIVNAVQTSRTITAGDGLTGGGSLAGNLLLALGTPSTLTATSPNASSATSHTHSIDLNSFFGDRLLAPEGYIEILGGFKIMWGTTSISGGTSQTKAVSFPKNFDGIPFGVQCTYRQNTDNDGDSHWAQSVTQSGFILGNDGAANSVFWLAYGV